jgi:tetratricopeptide (TPR) repeat protein
MGSSSADDSPRASRRPRKDLLLSLTALLLLTASAVLIADITHRVIAADPDGFAILSIAAQVATAVIASSAFTKSGAALLEAAIPKTTAHSKILFRLKLSLVFFTLAMVSWLISPPLLAKYYFTRGYYMENARNYSEAITYYQRAIALDPKPQYFFVNAGVVLERFYRYDDAQEQYRKAIVASTNDPVPYNDLGRILLLNGKQAMALRVLQDGLGLPSPDPVVQAGLLKNKAWAGWLMGFPQAAIADAQQSQAVQKKTANPNAAAATCLLGKIYTKLGHAGEAKAEWKLFAVQSRASLQGQPDIEPDCQLSAEAANDQK